MSHKNQSGGQRGVQTPNHNELSFTDPHGEYQFEVEVDATGARSPGEFPHRVYAHRRYSDVSNIVPVWPSLPAVQLVLDRLIHSRIEGKDGPLASPGVTITTVFDSTSGSGYRPADILINGHPIGSYSDIDSAGFWQVPDRLVHLVESQSPRGVTNTEIPFDACRDRRVPTAIQR